MPSSKADIFFVYVFDWWRWLPGMIDVDGRRVIEADGNFLAIAWSRDKMPFGAKRLERVHRRSLLQPDFSDPATVGCLEALVEEAIPGHHVEPNGAAEPPDDPAEAACWWTVYRPGGQPVASGPTKVAALVTARENVGG